MDDDPMDMDGWWHKRSARDKLRDWVEDRRREASHDGIGKAAVSVVKTKNIRYLLLIVAFFVLVYFSYEYRQWYEQQMFIEDRCQEVMRGGQKVLECGPKNNSSFGSQIGV